jgi:uncharacterized membrane protein
LYAIALNPLIGMTAKDTIEKVSIYLERIGRALSDEHGDPSISLVTEAAVAALRYETERVDGVVVDEPTNKPRIAGPISEQAA